MTSEKKKLDLSIFDTLKMFAGADKRLHKVWIEKDKIILNDPKIRSLMYTPEAPIFNSDFGISDLVKFSSMISLFDDLEIEIDIPNIVMRNSSNSQMMVFRTSTKPAFEPIIESNTKAKGIHDISYKLEEEGKHLEFELNHEIVSKIGKASSILSSGSAVKSIFRIEKDADCDDIKIIVTNEATENVFTQTVKSNNIGKIGKFSHSFNSDFILPGNWKVNVFDEVLNIGGREVPTVWCHMVDKESRLSLIIVYRNEG